MRYQRKKEDIPQRQRLSFALKQNEMKHKLSRKHPRNALLTSAEELGIMSKNNLRWPNTVLARAFADAN